MMGREGKRNKDRRRERGQREPLTVAVPQRIPRVSIMYRKEDKVQNSLLFSSIPSLLYTTTQC